MAELDIRRQKIVAKAKLDELKMRLSYGEDVAEAVATQEKIWIKLRDYSPLTPSGGNSDIGGVSKVYEIKHADIVSFPWEGAVDPVLIQLSNELEEIDNRKTIKINELQKLDRSQKHYALVQEIKAIRAEYLNKSDEIYYYKRHGSLPSADDGNDDLEIGSEFAATLPRDKYELHKKRKSLESSLSRFKGRLDKAKTDAAKQAQLKNIATAGLKINIIDQLMATI